MTPYYYIRFSVYLGAECLNSELYQLQHRVHDHQILKEINHRILVKMLPRNLIRYCIWPSKRKEKTRKKARRYRASAPQASTWHTVAPGLGPTILEVFSSFGWIQRHLVCRIGALFGLQSKPHPPFAPSQPY